MSITDELREWAHGLNTRNEEVLLAIADRIDAKHEKVVQRERETAYDAGYQNGENAILAVFDKRGNADVDKTMAEHGWYRALDADKKPIHLCDEVYQVEGGWVYTVKSITFYPDNTTVSFGCKHGFGCDNAHNVRHYHAPTVEDVLTEFGIDWEHESDCEDRAALLKEYAKRLKLAGDEET